MKPPMLEKVAKSDPLSSYVASPGMMVWYGLHTPHERIDTCKHGWKAGDARELKVIVYRDQGKTIYGVIGVNALRSHGH